MEVFLVAVSLAVVFATKGPDCAKITACPKCNAEATCSWTSCKGAVPTCTSSASTCDKVPCHGPGTCGVMNATNIVKHDLHNLRTGADPKACCAACAQYP